MNIDTLLGAMDRFYRETGRPVTAAYMYPRLYRTIQKTGKTCGQLLNEIPQVAIVRNSRGDCYFMSKSTYLGLSNEKLADLMAKIERKKTVREPASKTEQETTAEIAPTRSIGRKIGPIIPQWLLNDKEKDKAKPLKVNLGF